MKGELRKNQDKAKDTHPDWKGTAVIFGDNWNLAAWIRDTKDGRKYMSVKGQIGRDDQFSWYASLFRHDGKSAERPWDYYGKIKGREDIEVYGTNVRSHQGIVCELRFDGDVPLIPKDRNVHDDDGDVPF